MPLWVGPVFSPFLSHLPLGQWNFLTYINLTYRSMRHFYRPPLLLNQHTCMAPYWLPLRHIRIHLTLPLPASICHISPMQLLPIPSRITPKFNLITRIVHLYSVHLIHTLNCITLLLWQLRKSLESGRLGVLEASNFLLRHPYGLSD